MMTNLKPLLLLALSVVLIDLLSVRAGHAHGGGYHCHRGPLAGRHFRSQADAIKALKGQN